jgi:REP element-mobilizing transposase RayT
MPKQESILTAGKIYHLYNRAVADNLLFIEEDNYHFFLSKLRIYLSDCADILAYCLMPNHYHLLILLKNPDLPNSMRKLALSYVVSFNRMYKRSGHLFQGKYQRKSVGDFNYLLHLSRYIHINPLASGLVKKAEDWDYSSLKIYYGKASPVFIQTDFILDLLDDSGENSILHKQRSYKRFIEEWDPEYMSFKQK